MFKNPGESLPKEEDIQYSDLYKEIVSKNKNEMNGWKHGYIAPRQIENTLISINKTDYIELQNDLKELKNEIK